MTGYTGSCLCGAVRYQIDGEPLRTAQCHCDDCRRATGSAFATNVFVNSDSLTVIKGITKCFEHTVDSGNTMTKEFCSVCGSQIFGHSSGRPGIKTIKVGTIDEIGSIRPEVEVFMSKALPFTQHPDFTEKFDKGLPS